MTFDVQIDTTHFAVPGQVIIYNTQGEEQGFKK